MCTSKTWTSTFSLLAPCFCVQESGKPGKKIPPGGVSIFPGSSSHLSNFTSLSTSSSSNKSNNLLSTDNNLFGSGNNSESVESKENGVPGPKTNAASKQVSTGAGVGGGGGGLFDDDDDDDFFSGKSLKTSESGEFVRLCTSVLQFRWDPLLLIVCWVLLFFIFSAVKDKPKPKKVVDLFDEEDEDGDIFSEKSSAPAPAQNKKEVVEEQGKPPDKKVP